MNKITMCPRYYTIITMLLLVLACSLAGCGQRSDAAAAEPAFAQDTAESTEGSTEVILQMEAPECESETTSTEATSEETMETTAVEPASEETETPATAGDTVHLNYTKKTLRVGSTVKLKVIGSTDRVTWSTSKKSVATVSKKGKVTAKKKGTATITAKVGKQKRKCTITVKKKAKKMVTAKANGKTFVITMQDNAAARAFLKKLPMTINMKELNGNEKYHYMKDALPTADKNPGTIHTGDFMLYDGDCLVLFYKTFSTSYRYTKLGTMKDSDGLAKALGSGSVKVTFTEKQ